MDIYLAALETHRRNGSGNVRASDASVHKEPMEKKEESATQIWLVSTKDIHEEGHGVN